MRRRPKFRIGDRVAYAADRRTRRTIVGRYWDPKFPAWRYKLKESIFPRRPDLTTCWAPVESVLVLIKRSKSPLTPRRRNL